MRHDVVVVGAGPAGAAAAARLAGAGLGVLLLDRATFPRRKPCGECVSPAGVAALHALGAWDRVRALHPEPLHAWTITAHDGSAFSGSFPPGTAGIAVPRDRFDAALLEHARDCGAEVRTGVRVVEPVLASGRVCGIRTDTGEVFPARAVVGADGLRSVIVRRLGMVRRPPRLRKVALTAHLTGLSVPAGVGELRAGGSGCVGVARVSGELANVTVVLAPAEMSVFAGDREACFDASVAACGLAGTRVDEVLATGPFDAPTRTVIGDGVLLVGDAAGYYDPFTGQGIFRALRGAELASEVLGEALASGEPTRHRLLQYEQAHRAAFGPGERLQHLVEAFVSRPRWLGWAARRLARRPRLGDALIHATGDLLPPRALLSAGLLLQR